MTNQTTLPGPITITPDQQKQMKEEVEQQQIADNCMKEVFAVYEKYDCEPIIEAILTTEGPTVFRIRAKNKIKKEEVK